jgi:GTPase KRas protein
MAREEYKIVVMGDAESGKTSLIYQVRWNDTDHVFSGRFVPRTWAYSSLKFLVNSFFEEYEPTIEDSYRKDVVVDGRLCTLEILDTAGQEEYSALQKTWIQIGQVFVLVYSVTSQNPFVGVENLHKLISDTRAELGSISPSFMLIGNKCDLHAERQVSTEAGEQKAHELDCGFAETSAKTKLNLEHAVHSLVRELRHRQEQSTRISTYLHEICSNDHLGPEQLARVNNHNYRYWQRKGHQLLGFIWSKFHGFGKLPLSRRSER